MRKAEWANTDSRIEIRIDKEEVSIHTVYERDTYTTDDTSIFMSLRSFKTLLRDAHGAVTDNALDAAGYLDND